MHRCAFHELYYTKKYKPANTSKYFIIDLILSEKYYQERE